MCEARMVMSNWHIQYRYKVINWPKPQTPEDVLKFIGFVGYHRRFVKNFSLVIRLLTDLMPTPTRNTRKGNLKQRKHGLGKTNKPSI